MSISVIIATVVSGIVLIIAETFVPGGVIGAIGGLLVAVGVIAGFCVSKTLGVWLLVGSLVGGIGLFLLWMKYFPRSRMGKTLILQQSAKTWQGWDAKNNGLLQKTGTTHSALHPTGIALIEGRRVDVVSRGEMIDANRPVRVIEIEGNRVVVAEVRSDAKE